MNAEHLMLAAGVGTFALTLVWVRSRELRESYAVLWLGAASAALVCGLFPDWIKWVAGYTHLSYPSVVLFVSLAGIYLYAFTASVVLSQQFARTLRLTQEVALLDGRVRELERRLAAGPPAGGGS